MTAVWPDVEWALPDARVTVGDWDVRRFEQLKVVSAAGDLTDRCWLSIDNTVGGAEAFAIGQELLVEAGYRDTGYGQVFHGVLTNVRRERVCRLVAADVGLLLERHRVRRAFLDVTAADVVKACLEDAGIESYAVTGGGPKRHHFVAANQTVAQILLAVNRSWGLRYVAYAEPDGTVYWGPWESSPRATAQTGRFVFERGVNIVNLRPGESGSGELETVWMPQLRHSQLLGIRDPEFVRGTLSARAERVVHLLTSREARTTVRWRLAA